AAKRHDIIGVQVHDPAEAMLPSAGLIKLRDPESGITMMMDTQDPRIRRVLAKDYEARLQHFKEQFNRANCDSMALATDQPYIQEFHRFFKRRASA
ncbi:MAG TPA: hypothetical protein VJ508_11765, partial [Saprospiraceae bacterium]|nr:hypothetical protein [Saprospiraceae bacterium]